MDRFFQFSAPDAKSDAMKCETIEIDKAGRVALPKPLRKRFNLAPGDKLRLSIEGTSIKLEPTESAGKLVREGSVLVFAGGFMEPITTLKIEELIREEREGGLDTGAGK